ncbi:MAG: hypothetical protein QOJ51_6183 [Acidobacteriaceae bacterium]|jgi:hypothetical protein|nr:hypothetical protein [Acidobacteriaceae bacterium]MEA2263358.1 hypothetical protein [Acidobacteriaceae bacterium]
MIMPCINATSACDRCGTVGRVEGGSVLLGSPGAPGWTTEGAAGVSFCAYAAGKRNIARTGADISRPSSAPGPSANRDHPVQWTQ